MTVGLRASDPRVAWLNDAERLLLWALRHRVAGGDGNSAELRHAFNVFFGDGSSVPARAALDAFVVTLDTCGRRPFAFRHWCHQSLTDDEAELLQLCAEAQAGLPLQPRLLGLVHAETVQTMQRSTTLLADHFQRAGLKLRPLRSSSSLLGEHHAIHASATLH